MHRESANPPSFFSGFLHDFGVSCLLLSIAPVRSVQVNRTEPWQKQTCQNMPKHGSRLPETFSEIKPAKTCLQTAFQKCVRQQDSKHAKSCQDTTCQTYINKQASNMAVDLLKESQKLVAATAHAQITNALQCATRSILCTKHAKSCQDTTCQTYVNKRHQTCQ